MTVQQREADRLTWEQCSADHAWHDNKEHGQQFEVASQHTPSFGMRQRLGWQRPLDYYLHTHAHKVSVFLQMFRRFAIGPQATLPNPAKEDVLFTKISEINRNKQCVMFKYMCDSYRGKSLLWGIINIIWNTYAIVIHIMDLTSSLFHFKSMCKKEKTKCCFTSQMFYGLHAWVYEITIY